VYKCTTDDDCSKYSNRKATCSQICVLPDTDDGDTGVSISKAILGNLNMKNPNFKLYHFTKAIWAIWFFISLKSINKFSEKIKAFYRSSNNNML